MNMHLLNKAAQFEKLCTASFKKVAYDPTRPNTLPLWKKPPFDKLDEFGIELMEFDPANHPGVSLNSGELTVAGNALRIAFEDYKKNSNLGGNILKALENILTIVRDGGGDLYGKAKDLYTQVQKALKSAITPQPVAKKPAPPAWLSQYMDKSRSPSWLDEYMAVDKANEEQAGMQASLDGGNSVQETLNRPSYLPEFKQD